VENTVKPAKCAWSAPKLRRYELTEKEVEQLRKADDPMRELLAVKPELMKGASDKHHSGRTRKMPALFRRSSIVSARAATECNSPQDGSTNSGTRSRPNHAPVTGNEGQAAFVRMHKLPATSSPRRGAPLVRARL
jgi:hypothetical protein